MVSQTLECPSCGETQQTNFNLAPNDTRTYRGKCVKCNNVIRFKLDAKSVEHHITEKDTISFTVNGQVQTVGNQYPTTMTLNNYLRNVLNLTGTKVMCYEGGCGSCIVTGKYFDLTTQQYKVVSVNSCLFPLYNCNKWDFTTVEGIGCKSKGFHPIQTRIADANGTQCGYCTPGMVMNMYSLLQSNPKPSKQLIEDSFDGNICRCTGYRPILDAMKSFSAEENPIDIEDLNKIKCLSLNNHNCQNSKKVHIINDQSEWFIPQTLNDLYNLLAEYKGQNYTFVCGNTSKGVYKSDPTSNIHINLQEIPELNAITQSSSALAIGASVTLSKLIEIFTANSSKPGFEYLSTLASHFSKIANVSVRNMGTWSGNLSMKHRHPDFPSDVFVCFEAVGAVITLSSVDKQVIQITPNHYLNADMTDKFIYSITLPKFDAKTTRILTYKIMPRSQNAHAYVNAGFRASIDPESYKVLSQPSIVYGGISGQFNHAQLTEQFLVGKNLSNTETLSNAFKILASEIHPSDDPVLATPEYRRSLASSLLYKFFLSVCDKIVDNKFKSAESSLIDTRGISSGQQQYPVSPDMFPVTKPMPKLNAYTQASGEAPYVFDSLPAPNQLYGAFVLSSISKGRISQIDYSAAMKMPGVVKIVFAQDVPGVNNFNPAPSAPENVFSDGEISYAGQAIGLVVAQSYGQALAASRAVNVSYMNVEKPILTIADAIEAKSFHPKPCDDFVYGNAEQAIEKAPFAVNGSVSLGSQYHFYMETQVSIASPTEDGFEVLASTQWMDYLQQSVAQVLGVSNSSISVKIKQLGGAYGGKITRSNMVASAAAVAAHAVNKPVRVSLGLNENMEMVGKRFPWYAEYKVGFDQNGKLIGIIINYYSDAGVCPNDNAMGTIYDFSDNAYNCPNWHLIPTLVKTNTPANTSCRSPGTFPSIAIMEYIIEHVAKYLNLDPLAVRTVNLYKKGDVTPHGQPLPYFNVDQIIPSLIKSSDYNNRLNDVLSYNQQNRWKKRGISLVPIKWGAGWNGGYYNTMVSIYNGDGSVAIAHGGVESGQGISTKVVQVCAYELNIPMELIRVRNGDNMVNANSMTTGGSITSELVCQSIIECCKIINNNLEPVRKQMPPDYKWPDLIKKALSMGVDLCARYWIFPTTETPLAYEVYGAAVSEAIVDVLTGETQILRTDILYDCGRTINGEIDVGQAEGAFVMGMGFWLTEKIKYDPDTGILLTNGTWEYKPPASKDIPVDFRITFLDNNPNPLGVLGSKCIGEPPLCLTPSVLFAVKRAIEAARADIQQDRFFVLNAPATVDVIQSSCLVDTSNFTFK